MKRITENYDEHTKEDLLAECQSRGVEGVSQGSLKADIVAALELNDEQNAKAKPDNRNPNPLTPKPMASNIPVVKENIPQIPVGIQVGPKDEDFTDGLYTMRAYVTRVNAEGAERREATLYPGEIFALCIHDPNTYGRTHTLKNSLHYWEGTEGQFELNFEKA